MNLRDILMVKRGKDLGFTSESSETIRIGSEQRGQDLQRNVATELRIAGAVDLSHSTGAEERDDFVGAEASAGSQGHVAGVRGLYRGAPHHAQVVPWAHSHTPRGKGGEGV